MGRQFAGNRVDSQFLETMRMHLVRGRNFLPGEEGVVMITEPAARVLWRDEDALGKSLPWEAQGGAHGPTVVGVVANASTTVVGNPDYRVTRPHPRQQDNRREQPRHQFHIQPQVQTCRTRICSAV